MQVSPEIFQLRTLSDTVLVGPRSAFGRGHRHAVQSEDAVRQRLNRARLDPGALERLRRGFDRWRLGEGFSYLTDRALIDRVAADTRRGRLACYVVPNGEVYYQNRPDPTAASLKLADFQPRGSSIRIATAHRIISASAGAPRQVGAPQQVGGPKPGTGPGAALLPTCPDLPLNVRTMSIEHRLVEILHRTADSRRIGDETVTQLKALIGPDRIDETVAVLLVWQTSHQVGIDVAFDAVMLGSGLIFMGRTALDGARNLNKFLEATTNATSEADLEAAADLLAVVVVTLGIRSLQSAIKRGAARVTSGSAKPSGGFDRVEEPRSMSKPL